MMKRQCVILVAVFFSVGCAEDSLSQEGPNAARPQSDLYIHSASELTFPANIGVFARDEVHHYDDTQANTSVAYKAVRSEKAILVTVYVYPAQYSGATHEQALRLELEQIKSEMIQVYDIAEFEESEYRAEQTIGRVITFQAERELVRGRGTEPVFSVAYLFEYEGWFLKYRATCPVAQGDQVTAELNRIVATIGWPDGT